MTSKTPSITTHTLISSSSGDSGWSIVSSFAPILTYATTSITLTLANKHIFSQSTLNHPWMLLCVQSGLVALILQFILLLQSRPPVNPTLLRQLLIPCCFFTLFIFTNSRALHYLSLPILSVIKSLSPMGIALAERAILRQRLTLPTALAMLLIIVGNAITLANDIQYSLHGYIWAFANVFVNIAYIISIRLCVEDSFTPIEKGLHSNLLAFSLCLPLAYFNGEVFPFLQAFKNTSLPFRVVFFASAVLCCIIGASVFWVLQTSSGSTLSFVGACDKFLVVVLGAILFKAQLTPTGWMSVFVGLSAGVVFAIAKGREKVDQGG